MFLFKFHFFKKSTSSSWCIPSKSINCDCNVQLLERWSFFWKEILFKINVQLSVLRTVVLRLPAGVNPPHTSSWLLCSEGLCLFLEGGWGCGGVGESAMCWKRVSPFTLDARAPQARGQIKLPHPPVSHAENMDLVRFINSYPPQRRMKLHHVSFRCSHKFILWQAAAVASITWILQLPLLSIQGNLERFRSRIIVV